VQQFKGIVQKGKHRGRELGYPTLNIPLSDTTISGVYAGRVIVKDEAPYRAAIFADPSRRLLEAYILDFSDDLYGLEVSIEIHKKLRDAKKYDTDALLKEAIAGDVNTVREYFDHA
jgi:riboflavin kinase / FMN adenylyltransferase